MTASLVTTLRARSETVRVGAPAAGALTIRVQLAEAWDAVRVECAPTESVAAVKHAALLALDPAASAPTDYVVTWRGAEVLDETQSLRDAGVVNGATLLIALRRRRPVR